MGVFDEYSALHQIALGLSNIDEIASTCLLEKEQVRLIITRFLHTGLVHDKDRWCLSKKGLLKLSQQKVALEPDRSEYFFWSSNGLPFFDYQNKSQKGVITYPELFFEPASPYIDEEKQIVYETFLPEIGLNMENLEIVYNMLFETEPLHPIGFWLLGSDKRKLCGWGIENLKKTLDIIRKPSDLLFLCAFSDFIILISSDLGESVRTKMKIKVYITKANSPYLDTLDFLSDTLKPFLLFNGMQEIPKGQETQLEYSGEWKELPEPKLQFMPKLLGRISQRTANLERDPFPLVFVVSLPSKVTHLGEVSPWFVTCPGGCLDEDFKTLHYMHFFQVVNLPEIDIVSLMVNRV